MKILFLIDNDPPTRAVSEWVDIKKYKDQGYLTPSKEFYFMVKALEQNKEFENKILVAREKVGIGKDGILWEDYYYNYYLKSLTIYAVEDSKKYNDFISHVKREANKISESMSLDPYIENQINNLIIGNFVYSEDFPISIRAVPIDEMDLDEGYERVVINITHKVKLNTLTKFIEENWSRIESFTNGLTTKPNYYISKRDYRIVELKDKENFGWNEIANKIIKEFEIDDLDGKVNEYSVSRAYSRAKEKINLFTINPKIDK